MIQVVKAMQKAGQQIPILIGGATTSKIHTALKIAPHYDYPVIHVTDASQNPIVASRLLNHSTSTQYIQDLNTEYEQIRISAGQKHEAIVPIAEARLNRLVIDWALYQPVVPVQKGVHDLLIPPSDIIPYINWSYFFTAWGLSGRYDTLSQFSSQLQNMGSRGNGGNRESRGKSSLSIVNCQLSIWLNQFPEAERTKAMEATELYRDAHDLLQQIVDDPKCFCHARYGFFEAVSEGDDMMIGKERIPALRQQLCNERNIYHSLSDYIMPVSEGRTDYIGAFVVTVNALGEAGEIGEAGEVGEKDPYRQMLLQSLADRLAEASSEYLHQLVRKDFWGYASDESSAIPDLFKGKYQGIRPAAGYPSLPDQGIIFTLDKLLQFDKAGVHLTENGAMTPSASIAGLYFAHPQARYFMIGQISEEQLRDYAVRRNEPLDKIRKFLGKLTM